MPPKTIRYYEDIGLVRPLRSTSGYRDFADPDLHKLVFLACARPLGFTIGMPGHLDGAEMVKLMAWAQGIFTVDPAAAGYVADAHPVFKLPLFLGLAIFVIFPFTRLVHMLSVTIRYLWRPGYQVVHSRPAPRSPLPAGRRHGGVRTRSADPRGGPRSLTGQLTSAATSLVMSYHG